MLIIKGKVCTVQKSLIIKTVTEKYFTFSTCIIFVYNINVNLGFLNMNLYKKKHDMTQVNNNALDFNKIVIYH